MFGFDFYHWDTLAAYGTFDHSSVKVVALFLIGHENENKLEWKWTYHKVLLQCLLDCSSPEKLLAMGDLSKQFSGF